MNTRSVIYVLSALVVFATAHPNPSPIDADTARVIALNNNLGCSSGACNTTVFDQNSTNSTVGYTSGAWARQDTWSPFALFAAGGLAFSTGML